MPSSYSLHVCKPRWSNPTHTWRNCGPWVYRNRCNTAWMRSIPLSCFLKSAPSKSAWHGLRRSSLACSQERKEAGFQNLHELRFGWRLSLLFPINVYVPLEALKARLCNSKSGRHATELLVRFISIDHCVTIPSCPDRLWIEHEICVSVSKNVFVTSSWTGKTVNNKITRCGSAQRSNFEEIMVDNIIRSCSYSMAMHWCSCFSISTTICTELVYR